MAEIDYNSKIALAREEEIKNGKEEGKEEIAKKLIKMGMEINQIAKITGLSKEKIEKLKNNNN